MENVANNFKLVETVLIQNSKIEFWKEHMMRMKNSANQLGFVFDENRFLNFKHKTNTGILRILLDSKGDFEYQLKPFEKTKNNLVRISPIIIDSKEAMLFHKSDFRPWYQDAQKKIEKNLVFDEIFFNEKEEMTEGSRSNIMLQIDGQLYTAPVECGLLSGIMRQHLIGLKKVQEKILYKNDLLNAQRIFCINSVRQVQEVKLDFNR